MIRHKRIKDDSAHPVEPPQTFASNNCTELSYRITMPAGKFNVEKFSEAIGGASVSEGWNSVLLVSRNRDEYHVSADNFFDWLSQYVDVATASAHIHAEFEYPTEQWQSRIMALPIKVPFDDKTAVIEGLSIALPLAPQGVNQAWVIWNKKRLKLQIFADRSLHFKDFTPREDVEALNAVVKRLIGEKSL